MFQGFGDLQNGQIVEPQCDSKGEVLAYQAAVYLLQQVKLCVKNYTS